MGRRVGLLAGLLVLVLGAGAVAQEPSPEPPPWFGGRVEMPEHGFAVTLPDDWVAFDTAVDAVGQLEAASGFIDSRLWSADDTGFVDASALLASEGMQLWTSHTLSADSCSMGVLYRGTGMTLEVLDAFAAHMYEKFADDPLARDVELPLPVYLPTGPAYLMRMSERDDPDVDWWWPSSIWTLGTDESLLMAFCTKNGARPDDDWLSIVETIEFLPAEG